MMGETSMTALELAQDLSLRAARWLELLRFQPAPGGVVFSRSMTTYHDMLNTSASDARKLGACRSLLASVRRQAEMEEWKARSEIGVPREDLYGHEWHTTLRGAALETVAEQLDDAIAAFHAAGIEPPRK